MEKKTTGRKNGGIARASALSAEEKQDIARKAALARWGKVPPRATHGAPDKPLRIGEIEIQCYVLPDETRVLSQSGLYKALGISKGGGQGGVRKIVALMDRIAKKGINIKDLSVRANNPIKFIPPHGGNLGEGYEATILPDLCSVLIEADQLGVLDLRLKDTARRAAILQHGFATLGIISLVDEATGYQVVRARDALQAILDKFIRRELAAWVKTFPDEFFEQMYRLKKWPWKGSSRRPGVVGVYINDLVYARLGPGVLEELQRKNPTVNGQRKAKHFQWLTEDIGHPALAGHMYAMIGFMRVHDNWDSFKKQFSAAFPRKGENLLLNLDDPNA